MHADITVQVVNAASRTAISIQSLRENALLKLCTLIAYIIPLNDSFVSFLELFLVNVMTSGTDVGQ